MPLIRRLLPLLLAALSTFSGCALMDADDCAQADWAALGARDAESGHGTQRFAQRRALCEKAAQRVDAAAYGRGYFEGQTRYCSAERGQQDALRGQRRAAACERPDQAHTRPYREGFQIGLQRFCTPRQGYELGRSGLQDPLTCPGRAALDFASGVRLGQQQRALAGQWEAQEREAQSLRLQLRDPKLTQTQRDAFNRRLGQLDAEQRYTRLALREGEHHALNLSDEALPADPLPQPREDALPPPHAPAPAGRLDAADLQRLLVGGWSLDGLWLDAPRDLDGDGRAHRDALLERSACARDLRLQLGGDGSLRWQTGQRGAGCTPAERSGRWMLGPYGPKGEGWTIDFLGLRPDPGAWSLVLVNELEWRVRAPLPEADGASALWVFRRIVP